MTGQKIALSANCPRIVRVCPRTVRECPQI